MASLIATSPLAAGLPPGAAAPDRIEWINLSRVFLEWLEPLFDEHLATEGGRMHVSNRPGLGFTLSEQARRGTVASAEFGKRVD